jgi:hypothetical protein
MKRITEFTVPSANNGVTYIVECKYGEDLCTVYASNCPEYTWKENHDIVDNMFAKEDWITSEDKLELPSKFYITTSPDETAYKYLVTETEGGNYNVVGNREAVWCSWEHVESLILADTWEYAGEYKQEKIQGLETNWIIVDEMNELENTIAKWQNDNPEKPLADDFYFKAPCDCGSCFPKTLYRAKRMQGQLSETIYKVTWWDDELKERAEGFYSVEEVKDNIKKQEWVVVEYNGTDATGAPLNFTKDMLKPFMRFRTGNNGQYIAVESEVVDDNGNTVVSTIGASGRGWVEFELVNIHCDDIGEEYRVMSVYEKPEGNGDIINPDKYGKLIWQANK